MSSVLAWAGGRAGRLTDSWQLCQPIRGKLRFWKNVSTNDRQIVRSCHSVDNIEWQILKSVTVQGSQCGSKLICEERRNWVKSTKVPYILYIVWLLEFIFNKYNDIVYDDVIVPACCVDKQTNTKCWCRTVPCSRHPELAFHTFHNARILHGGWFYNTYSNLWRNHPRFTKKIVYFLSKYIFSPFSYHISYWLFLSVFIIF